MIGSILYLIGMIAAFIMCLRLIRKERFEEPNLQYDMLAPACLLSWIFVGLELWKLRDKIF